MTRILGIDYGSKRIGVAMTDPTGGFALPVSVIENGPGAVGEIIQICTENEVNKIVVGESKDFSGQDNPIMVNITKFCEELRQKSKQEVVLHPEFLTSAQAERLQGKNNMLDASAAAILLQSYLDTNS